jgi:hypothetical protein
MPINENKLKESLNGNSHQPKQKSVARKADGISPQEDKSVYDEILAIGQENNRLLKKLIRRQRWAVFFSFLKILIIVVPLVAAYIYLPPLLDEIMSNYRSAIGTVNELKSTTQELEGITNIDINDQLKQFEGLFK